MKKFILSAISIILVLSLFVPVCVMAETSDYTIVDPYEEVIWDGEDAWTAYKANLHTHSTISDATTEPRDMILDHYNQGFDVLAMTDHGVTGKAWNETPTQIPLYLYQKIIGYTNAPFTDDEFIALQNGTYPVDGEERGYGMTCITGGNELNALTLSKDHVNALFLPEHVGDNYLGYENDYEGAVKIAEENGAICWINHPGDWLQSNSNRANCSDEDNINYFADILLRYDSCLGIEVFNERNGVTPYDRDTWDNLLMACLPYGKTVIGYSNNDAHWHSHVDSSFEMLMMPSNTVDNVRTAVTNGTLFAVTKVICGDPEKYGPDIDGWLDASDQGLEQPAFTGIYVDGHKITVRFNRAYDLRWVANGNVIDKQLVTETEEDAYYTIDLDQIEGSEDFLYVRCQLIGEGGITLTQAFVIDDGTEPLTYEKDTSFEAVVKEFFRKFFSLRIFVLFKVLYYKVVD